MRSVEQILNTSEHCTDISIQEVESYLAKIKPDITNNKFTISQEKGTLVLSFHPSDKPDELIPLF